MAPTVSRPIGRRCLASCIRTRAIRLAGGDPSIAGEGGPHAVEDHLARHLTCPAGYQLVNGTCHAIVAGNG